MDSLNKLTDSIEQLENLLDYSFSDRSLLIQACCHCSFANENRDFQHKHNERLEFLGDSVLGAIVTHFLHQNVDQREGKLSSLKASLVDAPACFNYILKLGIEPYLLLGRGEKQNLGRGRESLLADYFEGVMGAIFLDGGFFAAEKFFLAHFYDDIMHRVEAPLRNWKAELQDLTQKHHRCQPVYEVLKEDGPDHSKSFLIGAYLQERLLGTGSGQSKKLAEQNAAERALLQYDKDGITMDL